MRRLPVVVALVALAFVGTTTLADDTESRISELRILLEQLAARVEALEAEGDPQKAEELAEIREMLDLIRTRIEKLEEEHPPVAVADPKDSIIHPVEKEPDSPVEFYGSLRVRLLIAEGGDVEIIDRFSRVGIAGRYPTGRSWSVLGRFEAGMNLVNQNPSIDVGGDPGFAFGDGSDAFTTRLGFVGFDTPIGSLTWGKQWGVYYDVASWTDQYFTYGGDASGAYAMGDGGINGTGRAETAFQYRVDVGPVAVGLQAQNRSRTERDRNYADTYGGSFRWSVSDRLTVGLAYNEVRDGVPEPAPNQPHLGDKAWIAGGIWRSEKWIASATLTIGTARERDDEGRYFDNRGIETFTMYQFDNRWSVYGGVNWLEPNDEEYEGRYEIRTLLGGVAYHINPAVVISGEGRLDDSHAANGSSLRNSVFALGVNLGW